MQRRLELYGKVRGGQLCLDPVQQNMRREWLSEMDGKDIVEALSLQSKPKTQSQLGVIFGLIVRYVQKELTNRGWDIYGAPWTEEQIKRCLYAAYHKHYGTTKTLSWMDRAEASEFIDFCFTFCANGPFKVHVPEPDPNWRNNEHPQKHQLSDAGAMPAGDLQGGPEGREKEKAVRGPHQADQGRGTETEPNGL